MGVLASTLPIDQKGTPALYSDTLANRPTAGFVGRLFISTDTFALYRDNGTTWDLIGGPGTGTVTSNGTIEATRIAFGSATNELAGDANFTYTDATNKITLAGQIEVTGNAASGAVLAYALAGGIAIQGVGGSGAGAFFSATGSNESLSLQNSGSGDLISASNANPFAFRVRNNGSISIADFTSLPVIRQVLIQTQSVASNITLTLPKVTGELLGNGDINTPNVYAGSFVNSNATGKGLQIQGGSTTTQSLLVTNYDDTVTIIEVFEDRILLNQKVLINTNVNTGENLIVNGTGLFTNTLTGTRFQANTALSVTTALDGLNGLDIRPIAATANFEIINFRGSGTSGIQFLSNGATLINLLGGNVIIGSNIDNGQKLQINGNVFADAYIVDGGLVSQALMGNGTLLGLEASTYVPVSSNAVNISANTPVLFHYIRTGNEVAVTGLCSITVTANNTTTSLQFSLPFVSDFLFDEDAVGVLNVTFSGGQNSGQVRAETTNNTLICSFQSVSTGSMTMWVTCTYTIK